MSKLLFTNPTDIEPAKGVVSPVGRRLFLRYAGLTAASTAILLAGCKDDDEMQMNGVDLGAGDTGILNYAYALEQLEAAFYSQVLQSKYAGMSTAEEQILTDIRDHEIAHRDFFKAALGSNAIPSLQVDFSSINFSDRSSVLGAAKAFEDLGVSAYNGAGKLLTSADFLLLAGKIVSVEARHAAAIRSLLSPKSADFAGDDVVTTTNGLDLQRAPVDVLMLAKSYVKTPINASKLPTM